MKLKINFIKSSGSFYVNDIQYYSKLYKAKYYYELHYDDEGIYRFDISWNTSNKYTVEYSRHHVFIHKCILDNLNNKNIKGKLFNIMDERDYLFTFKFFKHFNLNPEEYYLYEW